MPRIKKEEKNLDMLQKRYLHTPNINTPVKKKVNYDYTSVYNDSS